MCASWRSAGQLFGFELLQDIGIDCISSTRKRAKVFELFLSYFARNERGPDRENKRFQENRKMRRKPFEPVGPIATSLPPSPPPPPPLLLLLPPLPPLLLLLLLLPLLLLLLLPNAEQDLEAERRNSGSFSP